jgi:hypothetical protein
MANEVQRLLSPVMGEQERDAAVVALRAMLRRGELVDRDADLVRGAVEAMQTAPQFSAGGRNEAVAMRLADATKDRLGKFARSSPTSRKAALDNYPRSGTQRMEVLHRVARAGSDGATRDQLVQWLGKPPNVITPRVKELVEGGWLERKLHEDRSPAVRRTRAGSDAEVLVLTFRARQELRRRGVAMAAV